MDILDVLDMLDILDILDILDLLDILDILELYILEQVVEDILAFQEERRTVEVREAICKNKLPLFAHSDKQWKSRR